MFPTAFFCNRYYAPRYFPKVGAEPPPVDTSIQGDSVIAQAPMHRHVFPKHNAAIRRSGFSFSLPNLRLQAGA